MPPLLSELDCKHIVLADIWTLDDISITLCCELNAGCGIAKVLPLGSIATKELQHGAISDTCNAFENLLRACGLRARQLSACGAPCGIL